MLEYKLRPRVCANWKQGSWAFISLHCQSLAKGCPKVCQVPTFSAICLFCQSASCGLKADIFIKSPLLLEAKHTKSGKLGGAQRNRKRDLREPGHSTVSTILTFTMWAAQHHHIIAQSWVYLATINASLNSTLPCFSSKFLNYIKITVI